MSLTDSKIDLAFRRLSGTRWQTVLARIAVYGIGPYDAFNGYVSGDQHFVCPENSDRVIPPLFYKHSWLKKVDGCLPNVSAKTKKDYSSRVVNTFARHDVPVTVTQLRDRWFEKISTTATHAEMAHLKGVSLSTYARRCSKPKSCLAPGFLYVIRHRDTGLFKIGITQESNLHARLKVLGVEKCSELVELFLMQDFKDC